MTTKIKLLACALLVTPLLVTGVVVAHEGEDHGSTETTQTKKEHLTGNESLTLQQRVDKYKAAIKTRQDAVAKKRVQAGCKAAQVGGISTLHERLDTIISNRDESYGNAKDHLTKLSAKVKEKGVDTTVLNAQIAELSTKIDTYNTDLAKYKESVGDLHELDCVADPDAFKAALESSRTLRAQVVKDGAAIRTYMTDTIKPTLQTLRTQLQAKSSEGQ